MGSHYGDRERVERAAELPIMAYLIKPVDERELLATLEVVVARGPQRGGGLPAHPAPGATGATHDAPDSRGDPAPGARLSGRWRQRCSFPPGCQAGEMVLE